ncbi:MAG: hypothetical protein V4717_18565 [Bacteroidota bacterium]
MDKNTRPLIKACFLFFLLVSGSQTLIAQPELHPWGNMAGIRIEGELMDFETNISVVKRGWSDVSATGKERQRPKYERKGDQQLVTTQVDSFYITETVTDLSKDIARLQIQVVAKGNQPIQGIYLKLLVPDTYYPIGTIMYNEYEGVSLNSSTQVLSNYFRKPVSNIHLMSAKRDLLLNFETPVNLLMKEEKIKGNIRHAIYIPVKTGDLFNDEKAEISFNIKASGVIDKSTVTLQINPQQTGRIWDGFGGNFRLQNPKTDPQVIDYCLQNMRVAWGRVEMPWRFWQVNKNDNPLDAVKNGSLHPAVHNAMQMAQRLGKMGMPVILSAWSAPDWAIVGAPKSGPGPDGIWGNPLDTNNMQSIYKSIADYVSVLKEQYGVEVSMFSFNESDLGINIRQTGQEHASLIKGLGAYFEARGLQTKMLLGDNSDATTHEFIYPALYDAATHKYIGAISFHSWRGWEKETLQKWADAATELKRPLIVGEGSIDAQAWGYPAIFEEPTYALEEINLYVRLINICQPASILQWQLTADYSPLVGGGIFGNSEPLRPTQRFFNLKQLASIPGGMKVISARSDKPVVSVAALANTDGTICSFQIVNNGPARNAILSGIPAAVNFLEIITTNKEKSMAKGRKIAVTNGKASIELEARSYITLSNE